MLFFCTHILKEETLFQVPNCFFEFHKKDFLFTCALKWPCSGYCSSKKDGIDPDLYIVLILFPRYFEEPAISSKLRIQTANLPPVPLSYILEGAVSMLPDNCQKNVFLYKSMLVTTHNFVIVLVKFSLGVIMTIH